MKRAAAVRTLAAVLIAVSLGACFKTADPKAHTTSIAYFTADPLEVYHGGLVTLSWKAVNFGNESGTPSCLMSRRVQGEAQEVGFPVACEGSMAENPPTSSPASYIRYEFSALKRPYDPDDPYVSSTVTVGLLEEPRVLGVVLAPSDLDLAIGDDALVTATVTAQGGASTAVSWSSSDPLVASVDAAGTVRALSAGATVITATSDFDPTKSDSLTATVTATGALRWEVVIGGTGDERAGGVAADADGNVFVAVTTSTNLAGPLSGVSDVALAKFDADGAPLWSTQFGSSAADRALGLAVDGDGNVIVTGRTEGDLAATNAGDADAFVAKFGPDGETLWRLQFGTESSDYGTTVTTDGWGNVLVGGVTAGSLTGEPKDDPSYVYGFVAKFDANGTRRWTRQFYETYLEDHVLGIAVGPSDNVAVAVTGYRGSGYVQHFDAAGSPTWLSTFGTYHSAYDVAFDAAGDSYLVGSVTEAPNAIPFTAYLHKFDPAVDRLWERSLGPAEGSSAFGVETDAWGNVRVAGRTYGDLGGPNPGEPGFLMKYDGTGNRVWVQQFGPVPEYLAVDAIGNAFTLGTGAGGVHLMKFAP